MKKTKLQNPSLRKRKGFTLIELIVVIAILAILAAIAVPAFLGSLNRAKWNSDTASARVIVSAYQVYVAEGGTLQSGTNVAPTFLIPNYLDVAPDPQSSTTATGFRIDFNTNGSIYIVEDTAGNRFYPSQSMPATIS